MKLSRLYEQVIKFGIERDPRINKGRIKSYPDTAMLFGKPDTEVSKIMVGIDIEVGELLLADKLRSTEGLDLVIAHHPEGSAYAALFKVMKLQIDMLVKLGITKRLAEELLEERMGEVERKILPNNHMRSVDVARLLDMPFMCIHTPADNHACWFIQQLLDKEKPKKLEDILESLKGIPEYKAAIKQEAGPRIILGNPERQAGKIFVEMTGGTEGAKEAFDKLYKVGVRTLVSMHLSEEHFKKVKDANLNVVIAGHISSDNLGLNIILDRIEKAAKQRFQSIDCSGFYRMRR